MHPVIRRKWNCQLFQSFCLKLKKSRELYNDCCCKLRFYIKIKERGLYEWINKEMYLKWKFIFIKFCWTANKSIFQILYLISRCISECTQPSHNNFHFPLILAHGFVTLEITKLYTHAFWRVRKLRKISN